MPQDIWHVLASGAIVHHDDEMFLVVTYNGSQTFNVWTEGVAGRWYNSDTFSSSHVMDSRDAGEFARAWLDSWRAESFAPPGPAETHCYVDEQPRR